MGWNEINQSIGMLRQQDSHNRQKAVYDAQLQGQQQENAERAAISQQYNALAQAFQQSGRDLDKVASLVKDGPSMKAFAAFVQDFQNTEEGRKKGMEATTARTKQEFQKASGYIQKALSSQHGSEDWAANIQNAAINAPFTLRLGKYDQGSDSFEVLAADPVSGFVGNGERISGADAEGILKRIQASTIAAKDGTLFNKEWQDAAILYDIDRKSSNVAALMDPKNHLVLTNGRQTITAIPQLAESPADGYHYLVLDPQQGLTPMRDLSPLLQSGWQPTTQDQLNEETKFGLDQQRIGMQAWGHNIAERRLSHDQSKYSNELRGVHSIKDQTSAANTTIDNLRQRQNDILKTYAEFPSDTPTNDPVAYRQAKASAVSNLEQAAKGGDQRAVRDLQELMRNERDYVALMRRTSELAHGMTGIHHEPGPGEYQQLPGAAQNLPEHAPARGGMRGQVGGGDGGSMMEGARQAPDGHWYVQKGEKWFRVRQ